MAEDARRTPGAERPGATRLSPDQRDNAVRRAGRVDAELGIDLEGEVGDAITDLGWEWPTEINDAVPQELIDAVVGQLHPYIARLEEQVAKAVAGLVNGSAS